MKYIIMAAGEGKRWHSYLGIPKHLVEINGETLLARTTRLLKENGINDYIITCADPRYAQYGPTTPQVFHDCEIDRFEETLTDGPICFIYGDVYYTEAAIKSIITEPTNDVLFFGSNYEIFAIKVINTEKFFYHKHLVKNLYQQEKINRCIGWEVYRSIHNIPFDEHQITDDYFKILDETDDIDYPEDYENFKLRMEGVLPNDK